MKNRSQLKKYKCPCRYVYDPEEGVPQNKIPPCTPFEDLPADWICPFCGYEKEYFNVVDNSIIE